MRAYDEPRNPFVWSDLALAHANLGSDGAALREMDVACKLAPSNRIVVRTATRLFLHSEHPDRSLRVINSSGLLDRDPWVMAGDLAVRRVLGQPPQNVRRARTTIGDSRYAPASLSELRAALGTIEYAAGERRKAKRLFKASLESATDNALAQFAWAAEVLNMQTDQESVEHVPRSFEARALMLFRGGRWQDTVDQCANWLSDEPYSARPAVLGSFVASELLQDLDRASQFLTWGLSINDHEFGLLNNQSYCLALTNRIKDARAYYERISEADLHPQQRVVWLATRGAIEFRSGNISLGRQSYAEAIDAASRLRDELLLARAALNLAREELCCGVDTDLEAIRKLIDVTGAAAKSHLSVGVLRDRVIEALDRRGSVAQLEATLRPTGSGESGPAE